MENGEWRVQIHLSYTFNHCTVQYIDESSNLYEINLILSLPFLPLPGPGRTPGGGPPSFDPPANPVEDFCLLW